jgi:hypothetical protein
MELHVLFSRKTAAVLRAPMHAMIPYNDVSKVNKYGGALDIQPGSSGVL